MTGFFAMPGKNDSSTVAASIRICNLFRVIYQTTNLQISADIPASSHNNARQNFKFRVIQHHPHNDFAAL
jgi:hypothetical protein